jgi:predicted RNA binding protein YcfA (HicA-like mRNA interferase family)
MMGLSAAKESHPSIHQVWMIAVHPEAISGDVSAIGCDGCVELWLYAPVNLGAYWHGDGDWTARQLLSDGTLVATCGRHVAILHLHHGNRTVSIHEGEALASKVHGNVPRSSSLGSA